MIYRLKFNKFIGYEVWTVSLRKWSMVEVHIDSWKCSTNKKNWQEMIRKPLYTHGTIIFISADEIIEPKQPSLWAETVNA